MNSLSFVASCQVVEELMFVCGCVFSRGAVSLMEELVIQDWTEAFNAALNVFGKNRSHDEWPIIKVLPALGGMACKTEEGLVIKLYPRCTRTMRGFSVAIRNAPYPRGIVQLLVSADTAAKVRWNGRVLSARELLREFA